MSFPLRALGVAAACAWLFLAGGGVSAALPGAVGVGLGNVLVFAAIGLAAVGLASLSGEALPKRLGLQRSRLSPALVLVLAVGALGVSGAANVVIELLALEQTGTLGEIQRLYGGADAAALAAGLLGLALAPGIAEELLFRGWLQRGLERAWAGVPGGAAGALTLASAAFGALHLDWVQGTAAFLLGLYLGATVHIAHSLRPAILCHVANNALAMLATAWQLELRLPAAPAIAVGVAAGLGALGLAWWRSRPSSEPFSGAGDLPTEDGELPPA